MWLDATTKYGVTDVASNLPNSCSICRSATDGGDLRRIGAFAYEVAEVSGAEYLGEVDPGTEIEVYEGSLEVAAMVLAAAPILYGAITGYDSFWSGLERLSNHARKAGHFMKGRLTASRVPAPGRVLRTRVSVGHLATLERLHRDVHEHRRNPDQAVQAALRTLRRAQEQIDRSVLEGLESAFRAPARVMPASSNSMRSRSRMKIDHSAPGASASATSPQTTQLQDAQTTGF